MQSLNSTIDHTLLKPDATEESINTLCTESLTYGFAAVCILPVWVKFASNILKNSPVKICSVVGFPLGANTPETKLFEAMQLVEQGADEIDVVINISALKSKEYQKIADEIRAIISCLPTTTVKIIIESCLLSNEEKVKACLISKDAGAHFVKTSTGLSTGGATVEDIALMRRAVGPTMGVKASGGIRDYAAAIKMLKAGANRLGTSAGIAIVTQQTQEFKIDY